MSGLQLRTSNAFKPGRNARKQPLPTLLVALLQHTIDIPMGAHSFGFVACTCFVALPACRICSLALERVQSGDTEQYGLNLLALLMAAAADCEKIEHEQVTWKLLNVHAYA